MPVRLNVGDAVLIYLSDDHTKKDNIQIGVIKYIGFIHGLGMTEYVGIDLVETIDCGHDGTINEVQYFQSPRGHGIHTRIANVIRKLAASEVSKKMQEIIMLFKDRLEDYAEALSQRDEYIEELKNTQNNMRRLLREHGAQNALEALNTKSTHENKMNVIPRSSPQFSFLPHALSSEDNKFPSSMKPREMMSVESEVDTMSIGSGLTDLTLLEGRGKDSGLITLNTINEHGLASATPDGITHISNTSPPYSPRSDSEVVLSHTGSMVTSASIASHNNGLTSKASGLKTRYKRKDSEDNFPDTEEIDNHRRGRRRSGKSRAYNKRHRVSSSVGSIATLQSLSRYTQETYTRSYMSRSGSKKSSSKKRRKQRSRKKKQQKKRPSRKKRSRKRRESYSSYDSSETESSEEDSSDSEEEYEHSQTPPARRQNPVHQHRNNAPDPIRTQYYAQNRVQNRVQKSPIYTPPMQRPLPILPGNRMHAQAAQNGGLLTPISPTSPLHGGNTSVPNSPIQSWTQHAAAANNDLSLSSGKLHQMTRLRHQAHGTPVNDVSNLSRARSHDPKPQYVQQQQQPQQQHLKQQQPRMIRPKSSKFTQPVPELRQNPKPKTRRTKKKKTDRMKRKESFHQRSASWNPAVAAQENENMNKSKQMQHHLHHTQQQQQHMLQKPQIRHQVQYTYDHNNAAYYQQPQIDDWVQQQQQMQHQNHGRSQHFL